MKVVLAGPPKSGKSCLREGLKQAIRRISGAPYPYVITACPDGIWRGSVHYLERGEPVHERRLSRRLPRSLFGL